MIERYVMKPTIPDMISVIFVIKQNSSSISRNRWKLLVNCLDHVFERCKELINEEETAMKYPWKWFKAFMRNINLWEIYNQRVILWKQFNMNKVMLI